MAQIAMMHRATIHMPSKTIFATTEPFVKPDPEIWRVASHTEEPDSEPESEPKPPSSPTNPPPLLWPLPRGAIDTARWFGKDARRRGDMRARHGQLATHPFAMGSSMP